MNNSDLLLAGIISVLLIAVLTGIRFGMVSAKIGGIIMLVMPTILNAFFIYWLGGDVIDLICMGLLLSLAFGPATYIAGRNLEKIVNKNM